MITKGDINSSGNLPIFAIGQSKVSFGTVLLINNQDNNNFHDVPLASEEDVIFQAHKIILSAVSHFSTMYSRCNSQFEVASVQEFINV